MSGEASALIQLGAVGAPFGVRGWFKVRSDTDPPEALLDYPVWNLSLRNECREYEIQSSGRTSGQLTVKLRGIDDRDVAASLTGAAILIRRELLPPAGKKEFYRADLIGCEVENGSGRPLGTVQYFVETPAHALMVVSQAGSPAGAEIWVPAVADHIRRVDLKARKVIVNWEDEGA
jgi:16S rRNA processing protein RimM